MRTRPDEYINTIVELNKKNYSDKQIFSEMKKIYKDATLLSIQHYRRKLKLESAHMNKPRSQEYIDTIRELTNKGLPTSRIVIEMKEIYNDVTIFSVKHYKRKYKMKSKFIRQKKVPPLGNSYYIKPRSDGTNV